MKEIKTVSIVGLGALGILFGHHLSKKIAIKDLRIIANTYGWDKLLYCVAQGMDAVKEGNTLTYSNMGILCFGDLKPGTISDKAMKVARFFAKTDFPHEVVKDMNQRLWGKFMLNVGVNQVVAIYASDYGNSLTTWQKA